MTAASSETAMELERLVDTLKENSKMGIILPEELEEVERLIEIVGLNQHSESQTSTSMLEVFKNVLVVYLPQFSIDGTGPVEFIKTEVISQLQTLAKILFGLNLGNQCTETLITLHKESLEDSLTAIGGGNLGSLGIYKCKPLTGKPENIFLKAFEKFGEKIKGGSKQESYKELVEWDIMESNVENWKKIMMIFVKRNLSTEKRFCDAIFGVNDSIRCISEISFACMTHLLGFAEAIAESNQLEKMLMILEVYDVLVDLKPYIDYLYPGPGDDNTGMLKPTFEKVLEQVGNGVIEIFVKFKHTSPHVAKIALPVGTVHHSTFYVMNILGRLVDHRKTLNNLLFSEGSSSSTSTVTDGIHSPFAVHMQSLISTLIANLEMRSLNQGTGVLEIILMTNKQYIVAKISESELRTIVGQEWMNRLKGEIARHTQIYLRSVWNVPIEFLDLQCVSAGTVNLAVMKGQLKNFCKTFRKIYETQTGWLIEDSRLRNDTRLSVSTPVLHAYAEFRKQMGNRDIDLHYLKYTPDEIESFILELFEGSAKRL